MKSSNQKRGAARRFTRALIAVMLAILPATASQTAQPAVARNILLAPPGVTVLSPSQVVAGVATMIEMTGSNIGPSTIVTITAATGGVHTFTGFSAPPYTFVVPALYTNANHDITVVIGNDGDSEDAPRTLDVIPGPAASVLVNATPATAPVPVLATITYNAIVWDAHSNPVDPVAPLTWEVTPSGTGITLTAGSGAAQSATFVSSRPGNYNITAKVTAAPTVQTTVPIEVVNAGPYTVRVEPSSPQKISITEQRVFTATLSDVAGNPMPATFTWTTPGCSGNTSGVTEVSPTSSNSTVSAGATTTFYAPVRDDSSCAIQATVTSPAVALNRTANTAITVTKIIVSLTPPTATLGINEPLQFTALISDTDIKQFLPTVPISWFAQSGAGTITQGGLFTAGTVPGFYGSPGVRAAPYKIRLNGQIVVGDDIDTSTITVVAGPVARIAITPADTSLIRGATQLFTASAFDAANNPIPNAVFTWSLTNAAAGSITTLDPGGVTAQLTAGATVGAFPAVVSVSSGAASATANVNVIEGTVTRIEVNPIRAVLGLNQSFQFTATVFDNSNNPVTVPLIWTSNPLAGSVGANGLFTALGAPGVYANGVTARSGSITATAVVEILPIAPARIEVVQANAALPVSTTRQFQVNFYDALNRLITDTRLSVIWSSIGAGRIESSGPLTAVLRAGVTPGDFVNGIAARYGATIAQSVTVRVLQPVVTLQSSVGAGTLDTDGFSRSYMTITVDSVNAGGRVGAGVPIDLRVTPEDGVCTVTPAGVLYTDLNGQAFASMTCLNYSLNTADIDIDVRASLRPQPLSSLNSTITHRGRGRAFSLRLPVVSFPPVSNNHDACSAAPLRAGVTVYQAANNAFNLYLLTAGKTSHTFSIDNYPATGELQLFRVTATGCPVQASIVTRTPLAQGSTRFTAGNLTVGGLYILAVRTNAPLSQSLYRLKFD
jgi:hypothetical protein